MTDLLLYGAAILVSFAVVRWFPSGRPLQAIPAAARETAVVLLCYAVAFLLSAYRFLYRPDMAAMGLVPRLLLLVLVAGFIHALFPFVYFKWIRGHALDQLGWRTSGWQAGIAVAVVFGLTAVLLRPDGLQFRSVAENEGWAAFITLGLFTAALPEETMRFYAQTRLEALTGSFRVAWMVTALLWALMHLPLFYSQADALLPAVMNVLALLPLGLLWGYMTRRFSAVVPAVLMHATNLWGLQNVVG